MEKIKITNFRKVKNTWELDLAPVTYFTGTNNSGKSSVLKALMVLSDFTNSSNHLLISFNGKNYPKHKIDCYSNAANWNNNINMPIGFQINHQNFSIAISFSPFSDEINADKLSKGRLSSLIVTRDSDGATFKMERIGGDRYQLNVNSLLLEKSNLSDKETSEESELKQLNTFLNHTFQKIKDQKKELEIIENKKKELLHFSDNKKKYIRQKIESKKDKLNNFINHLDSNEIKKIFYSINKKIISIIPDLEFYNKKKTGLIKENNTNIRSLMLDIEKHKQKITQANSDQLSHIDIEKHKRFIRRLNENITKLNNTLNDLKEYNKLLSEIDIEELILKLNESSLLMESVSEINNTSADPADFSKLFGVLLNVNNEILQINDTIQSSKFNDKKIVKSINSNISKLKETLFNLEIFDEDDELKQLETELMSIIDLEKEESIRINKETANIISSINSLNDKVKGLKTRIKQIEKRSFTKKDELTFNPTFDLDDLQLSEPSLDKIIRNVMERYFTDINYKDKKVMLNLKEEISKLIHFGDQMVDVLTFSVDHLSPHRNSQTRLYVNENTSSDIYELINAHAQNPIDKRSKAGKFIKKWMQEFDIGDDYRIRSIEGMASIIDIEENNKKINLVDKGFGAGQIFAILLKIAESIDKKRANKGLTGLIDQTQLILIEEPEANLHPALQSKLAELFYDAYKNYGIRFIVETHSEYILRKTQVLVKEIHQNNSVEDIPFGVYYFHKENGPYNMEFRKDGKFINEFGPGFFDVSSNLTFEIL